MKIAKVLKLTKYTLLIIILIFLISVGISSFYASQGILASPDSAISVTGFNYEISNGSLFLKFDLHILNKGFYSLQNSRLQYFIVNGSSNITSGKIYLGNIVGEFYIPISIPVSIINLVGHFLTYNISQLENPVNLRVYLKFLSYYAFNFFTISLSSIGKIKLPPPLLYFNLGKPQYNINNSYINIEFPLTIDTAFYLKTTSIIKTILQFNNTILGYYNATLELGTNYTLWLKYNVPISYENSMANNYNKISILVWIYIYDFKLYLGEFK